MKRKQNLRKISICLAAFILCSCTSNGEKTYMTNQDIVSSQTEFDSLPDNLDTSKKSWGQGVQYNEENQPVSCIDFQAKYGKYDALFIGENSKKIYLTFDEGYENGYTADILDVLKENQVPAIFFVTYDYVTKEPNLVKRMIDEGHEVENHSVHHLSMPTLSKDEMRSEIVDLSTYVKENFAYDMHLFRPPMGEFSEQSLAVAKSLGYQTVFWSFAYQDWNPNKQPSTQSALKKMKERLHPGAIYLLHAVSKTNKECLGEFIKQAKEEGFEFALL